MSTSASQSIDCRAPERSGILHIVVALPRLSSGGIRDRTLLSHLEPGAFITVSIFHALASRLQHKSFRQVRHRGMSTELMTWRSRRHERICGMLLLILGQHMT